MKTQVNVNGRKITLELITSKHSRIREAERVSFEIVGPSIMKAFDSIISVADNNRNGKNNDLMIVNEWAGHSVVLACSWVYNILKVVVKTVIDEGRNAFNSHPETTVVVKV